MKSGGGGGGGEIEAAIQTNMIMPRLAGVTFPITARLRLIKTQPPLSITIYMFMDRTLESWLHRRWNDRTLKTYTASLLEMSVFIRLNKTSVLFSASEELVDFICLIRKCDYHQPWHRLHVSRLWSSVLATTSMRWEQNTETANNSFWRWSWTKQIAASRKES